MSSLMYGAGLRLMECPRLRVQDIDFSCNEILGHKDVSTTMIYTHVLNKGGHGVRSPVDRLKVGLCSLYKPEQAIRETYTKAL